MSFSIMLFYLRGENNGGAFGAWGIKGYTLEKCPASMLSKVVIQSKQRFCELTGITFKSMVT